MQKHKENLQYAIQNDPFCQLQQPENNSKVNVLLHDIRGVRRNPGGKGGESAVIPVRRLVGKSMKTIDTITEARRPKTS